MSASERCEACLSLGRRVAPMGALMAQGAGALLQVCWECRALCDKSRLFGERVCRAQAILASLEHEGKISSISTLGIEVKKVFDYTFVSEKKNAEEPISRPNATSLEEETEERNCIIVDTYEHVRTESSFVKVKNTKRQRKTIYIMKQKIEAAIESESDEGSSCIELNDSMSPQAIKDHTYIKRREADGPIEEPGSSPPKTPDADKAMIASEAKVVVSAVSVAELRAAREAQRGAERYVKSPAKCPGCIIGFLNSALLVEHNQRKHHPNIGAHSCDVCAVRFSAAAELAVHRKRHFQVFACAACGVRQRTRQAALVHYADAHEPERVFPCGDCNLVFPLNKELSKHRQQEHSKRQPCPHCKRLIKSIHFTVHLRRTHGKVPLYECAVCGRSCRGRNSLGQHMLTHADGGEDAYCAECDRQFKTKYIYQTHLKTALRHIDKETAYRFACDKCNKKFKTPLLLRTHVQMVHLKLQPFKCDSCDKAYTSAGALRCHVRETHEGRSRTKDVFCGVCEKAFSNKSALKAHSRTHTRERPFACLLCPATFNFNAALYTHNKLKHKMTTAQIKSKLGVE